MPNKGTILIVEDETGIAHVLTSVLQAHDYNCLVARTGEQALMIASSHRPDAVLLDLGLPRMDGVEVLRRLREWYDRSILVVSARDQEKEKVRALDLGADDYIVKPFGPDELLARIRATLRVRAGGTGGIFDQYQYNGLFIDFGRRLVQIDGQDVHLTQIEYKIIEQLAHNAGRVLTYDYLMEQVWGSFVPQNNRILRVNMANIRRKLEKNPAEPQYIQTEMGVGYRMAENQRQASLL